MVIFFWQICMMDQLPKSTQDAICKTSSLRLQHNLLKVGVEEEIVEKMEHQQLVAAWAQIVDEGKDKSVEGAATADVAERTLIGLS